MMLMITFEGHKTNRPFHNQGHGVSNQMKAEASNPSINGENEPLLSPIQIHTRPWKKKILHTCTHTCLSYYPCADISLSSLLTIPNHHLSLNNQ